MAARCAAAGPLAAQMPDWALLLDHSALKMDAQVVLRPNGALARQESPSSDSGSSQGSRHKFNCTLVGWGQNLEVGWGRMHGTLLPPLDPNIHKKIKCSNDPGGEHRHRHRHIGI